MLARMNLSDAVDDLAPPPPPCFENRMLWRDYLKSAATAQYSKGEQRVILLVNDEPQFNTGFNFCRDCDSDTRASKQRAGRCNPRHLKDLAEA